MSFILYKKNIFAFLLFKCDSILANTNKYISYFVRSNILTYIHLLIFSVFLFIINIFFLFT